MAFKPPVNSNYCATVVEIKNLTPLDNCDNVVGTSLFGFQAIVGKSTKVGSRGIFFPAETQLSEDFCHYNNLFRHAEKNTDPTKSGYIEDNRRIRAVKFRGHRSNGLFMPIESLWYLGIDSSHLSKGMEFDEINGQEICRKYSIPVKGGSGGRGRIGHDTKRVDAKFMPEHYLTDNYFRNNEKIPQDQEIIITQKLHGTSIRVAHTKVKRTLTIRDRIAGFFGAIIKDHEYDRVFGSRKVIKDPNNPNHRHFYDVDIWTTEGKKIEECIPENFILYGELIGYVDTGAAIQSGYTYQMPQKTCELYVYRVAFVNDRGLLHDLSWEQVKFFCKERNLKVVPEIYKGPHNAILPMEQFLDTTLADKYPQCLPLDANDTVDEGVCIRVDGMTPYILKAKSPLFYEWETTQLDQGTVDLETVESTSSPE